MPGSNPVATAQVNKKTLYSTLTTFRRLTDVRLVTLVLLH
jgi:hypothetical protein